MVQPPCAGAYPAGLKPGHGQKPRPGLLNLKFELHAARVDRAGRQALVVHAVENVFHVQIRGQTVEKAAGKACVNGPEVVLVLGDFIHVVIVVLWDSVHQDQDAVSAHAPHGKRVGHAAGLGAVVPGVVDTGHRCG